MTVGPLASEPRGVAAVLRFIIILSTINNLEPASIFNVSLPVRPPNVV